MSHPMMNDETRDAIYVLAMVLAKAGYHLDRVTLSSPGVLSVESWQQRAPHGEPVRVDLVHQPTKAAP